MISREFRFDFDGDDGMLRSGETLSLTLTADGVPTGVRKICADGSERVGTVREVHGDGSATVVLDRPDTDESIDDGRRNRSGDWYTIKGEQGSCSCGHASPYLCESAHPHRVIVWPSQDDPNLVKCVRRIEGDGDPAEVLPYEQSFGPAISFYELTPS